MIVCNCRGASDRDVNAAIHAGALCLSDLQRCGIGGDCGGCEDFLRAMIAAAGAAPRPPFRPLAAGGDSLSAP